MKPGLCVRPPATTFNSAVLRVEQGLYRRRQAVEGAVEVDHLDVEHVAVQLGAGLQGVERVKPADQRGRALWRLRQKRRNLDLQLGELSLK